MKPIRLLAAAAAAVWLAAAPAPAYIGETEKNLNAAYGSPVNGFGGWKSYVLEDDVNPAVMSQLRVLTKDDKVIDAVVTHIQPKPLNGPIRIQDVPLRMREQLGEVGLRIKAAGGHLVGRFQRYRELYYVYQIPETGGYRSILADYTLVETDRTLTYRYRVRYQPGTPRFVLEHLPDKLSELGRRDDPLETLLQGR